MKDISPFMAKAEELLHAYPVLEWLLAVGLALLLSWPIKILFQLTTMALKRLSRKTSRTADDIIVACLESLKAWVIFFWLLHPAVATINASPIINKITYSASVIASALQVLIWGLIVIRSWNKSYLTKKVGRDSSSLAATELMGTMVKGLFITIIVLLCLSNLGVNISTLIAGLGVGGIAVALAAQNILGDIFGSLSIVLDKPFEIGDFITVGNSSGTVENIGIKTTRVRSISGEQLIFSNKDLLESRIQNYKRMWQRRVLINFNIPHTTALTKVKMIPQWVKSFISEDPKLSFERCHLASLGGYALNYELVYFVNDSDFNAHMNLQQEFLFKMLHRLKENDIEIALPTQYLYIAGSNEASPRP